MQYRRRTMLAAFAGSVWIGSLLLARPGVVTTQSGARYEGEVIERGDDIMVNIRGVQTTINRGDVASLEYSVSFEEEFQTRLKKLDEKDVAGRIELAKWAMQKQQYVSARDALELALVIDPNSSEAVDLQTLVRSQMRLAQQAKLNAARDQAKPTEQSEPTTDKAGTPPAGRPMLGQEDVQAIRRIEWRADDPAVRLRIDKKAARQYADMKSMRWEEFSRQRPIEQARMILEDANASAEQKQGVTILSDPQALSDFRRLVQPVMLTGCATSGCHGGANAKFPLIYPSTTDEAVYTNFYRLSTFKQKLNTVVPAGGIFGGATELNMIDRGNAARSLLMQYSFPPEVAEFDHPKVMNFEPVFQSMNDPRAKPVIDWIDRALKINPDEFAPNWDGGPRKAAGTGNGK